jgi:hypothetical protein
MTRVKLIGCVVILSGWLAVVSIVADTNSLPDLRNLDTSGWDCVHQPVGTPRDAAGAARNRGKNRDRIAVTSTNVPEWTFDEFLAHAHAYDADVGVLTRHELNPEQAAKLALFEKQIVSLTGWLNVTYPGPPESCNCGSTNFHDWHVELTATPLGHAPHIGDPTPVICEVTPRVESHLYQSGARLQALAEFIRLGNPPDSRDLATGSKPHKVRVTGYLLWDDQHNQPGADIGPTIQGGGNGTYYHPWRQTAWEIHPILKIEDLGTKE